MAIPLRFSGASPGISCSTAESPVHIVHDCSQLTVPSHQARSTTADSARCERGLREGLTLCVCVYLSLCVCVCACVCTIGPTSLRHSPHPTLTTYTIRWNVIGVWRISFMRHNPPPTISRMAMYFFHGSRFMNPGPHTDSIADCVKCYESSICAPAIK